MPSEKNNWTGFPGSTRKDEAGNTTVGGSASLGSTKLVTTGAVVPAGGAVNPTVPNVAPVAAFFMTI